MLICEGIFFIFGLIALIAGKFRLYGKRTIQGTRARIVGIILMLPAPCAFMFGFAVGLDQPITQETAQMITVFEFLLLIGAFIVAAIVTFTTPEEVPSSPQVSQPEVLTPAEAARYLRVSEEQVLQLIESGDLQARKIGDQFRIDRKALDSFLNK